MVWSASTVWWLLAGVLVVAELLTGTFYLLMVAIGAAAGALMAWSGFAPLPQVVIAVLLGLAATGALWLRRRRHPATPPAASNRDVNLDIGQTLQIPEWQPDGTARAPYRGAAWSVRFAGPGMPLPGEHVIVALHGSELRVAPATAR